MIETGSSSDSEEGGHDVPDTLLGSGEYQIVGIRYYNGVAHPGEFVTLVREPNNLYDRNAIRVDNLNGDKVGHVKATMAKSISAIMDNGNVRLEGTIPRSGNAYTLPLVLDFYSNSAIEAGAAAAAAESLKDELKRRGDYQFRLSPEFAPVPSSNSSMKTAAVVQVQKKKMDWNSQQAALDKMFDKQLEELYKDLPDIAMPSCLVGITLMDYQVNGIKWLVKKETNASPAPFYKEVREKNKIMHLCEITNSSQTTPPAPVQGSILCDEMGLGKSIQTIALILLAPPANVRYDLPSESEAKMPALQTSKSKRCTLIVCPVSVLGNWTDQVRSFVAPGVLNVQLYHGADRHQILTEVQEGNVDILLVSYNTLASDHDASDNGNKKKKAKRARTAAESIFDIDFHRIVLDEAHTIRNSKTRAFKGVSQIKADRKLALTGTPFVNTADDIYCLLSFLGVQPLNEKSIFTRAITQPIKNGDEIGLTRLRATMGFISLRRSKRNVNISLVEKDVQLCSVEWAPSDPHKKVYDALFGTVRCAMAAILDDESKALKNYSVIFEKLLRLRQACCSAELITEDRRAVAVKVWEEMRKKTKTKKLTAEEGLALLEKLKSAFATDESDSLPECGICLMEMDVDDGTILKRCNHIFCKLCVREVFAKSNKKCPYCRAPFEECDIVDASQAKKAATENPAAVKEDSPSEFGTPAKVHALLDAFASMKGDEKGVVFSQFTSHLDIIGVEMRKAGHSFVRIDGSVSAIKRIANITSFNSDGVDAPRFILCSLLAAGTGINLTRANWCFMMDVWWNEAVESQAMDRIHRLSQTRKVTVLRFVMKDSIEEAIIEMQERKSVQAKGVMQKLKGDERRKALLVNLRGLLQIKEE